MDEKVVSKGRLGPGMMISVNLETGEVNSNTDIKKRVASAYPYAEWLAKEVRSELGTAQGLLSGYCNGATPWKEIERPKG